MVCKYWNVVLRSNVLLLRSWKAFTENGFMYIHGMDSRPERFRTVDGSVNSNNRHRVILDRRYMHCSEKMRS